MPTQIVADVVQPHPPVEPVPPIQPSLALSTSASSFSSSLTDNGIPTSIGPVNPVYGTAPPAFCQVNSVPGVDISRHLDSKLAADPVFKFMASELVSAAGSSGFAIDNISASTTATLTNARLLIETSPTSPPGAASLLGLFVNASSIRSTSDVSVVFPDHASAAGSVGFGSLTVGGGLIGKTLHFSGEAAPNTVLYNGPTVTVTLDKQVILPPPPVSPLNSMPVANILTEAVDISLNRASLFGSTVSGDIIIGQSSALERLFPMPPIPTPVPPVHGLAPMPVVGIQDFADMLRNAAEGMGGPAAGPTGSSGDPAYGSWDGQRVPPGHGLPLFSH